VDFLGKSQLIGSSARSERQNDGGGISMCANCGCGSPEDNHGDDRNINWSEIVASAEANDITPAEAVQNIQKMAEQQG
jgi:hypothetical protein